MKALMEGVSAHARAQMALKDYERVFRFESWLGLFAFRVNTLYLASSFCASVFSSGKWGS